MTVLLTGDWSPFGKDDYFRRFEVYSMGWPNDINLDSLSLTSSNFGGPLAVMRDRNKVVKVQGGGKPVISMYSSSGNFISSIIWNSGKIVKLGWSSLCDLLCILEDGHVLIYDMFSNFQHRVSMGQEAQDTKVLDAKIFNTASGTGVAVLTTTHRIFLVNSVREAKVRRLPEVPGVHNAPTAWTVVCEDRHCRVLFARERDLYSLNEGETHPHPLTIELGDETCTIIEMAVSSNYERVAIFTDRGKLWIGSSDLKKCTRLYDTRSANLPTQLVWCGVDAVVINWGLHLELVGPFEESLHYNYDETVFCIQEVDCIRVVSSQSMDIIQKVPEVVRNIFGINSTAAGSYLLEASKQYQKKNHRANEYLHLVKPKLFLAVRQCIEAAGHEFKAETQKMLMKAAQFGKTYLDDCSPENYVTMIRVLRCLNAVRHPNVGMPITYNQLQILTLQGLMELQMIRRNHFLALDLATFLKMPDSSKIRLHWACYKVEHSKLNDELVAKEIAEKIGSSRDVSYIKIAKKAADCGRNDLAIKLIEYEPRANLQVPLLLRLGEDQTALIKAIESGNTDLVYAVLLHMKENMPLGKFQMEIRSFPLAQALYLKYCRLHNKDMLKDVYIQEDDHKSQAECYIRESFDPKNSSTREASLVAAEESYKRAKLDLNATLCEEHLRLSKYQRNLEDKFKRDFFGKSLHDTLKLLLTMQEVKLADKLRHEYKVPDRRYWWLRVKVLGELGAWSDLEKLSKSKKSPIGYEPFVEVCWKHGNRYEAQKYLPKVKDDVKVEYLTKLGMFEEAAQMAFEQKDLEGLRFIESKCDPSFADKVASFIRQLSK
uniref:Vacuolar protein sorting-associated protein 16 homolog n=1 Tax=Triatoma infestans TaxID=30076 RepID=A0A023F2B4_TRIIF